MELDEEDRRAHVRTRTAGVFSLLATLLVAFAFVAIILVVALEGSSSQLKSLLVEVGLLKRADVAALYRRWVVAPPSLEQESANGAALETLLREPCAERTMLKLADRLAEKGGERWAADALTGWSKGCAPDNSAALRRAASLYIDLHDYPKAEAITADLLAAHPTVSDFWYLNGKAAAGLSQTENALLSYANAIHLAPRPEAVGRWVFQEMSDIYAGQKRFCEAVGPMQDYMSIDLARRATPQADEVIAALVRQGRCTQFATGGQSFPTGGTNVIRTRASIDGVPGIFVVDTGASFVTVTQAFATKAHLAPQTEAAIRAVSANGDVYAHLATADTIKVGRVEAKHVPVAIQNQTLGDIDGLLGRSFLSRFDLTIGATQWTLRAKALSGGNTSSR